MNAQPATSNEAPTTTAEVAGPATNGWYTGPATVTLTATDNAGGSGVARTEYQVDAATEWTPYAGPVTVSGDGVHQVRFRSVDEAGNTEAASAALAPITTATAYVDLTGMAPGRRYTLPVKVDSIADVQVASVDLATVAVRVK